jgi:signal transduction histidine kinase
MTLQAKLTLGSVMLATLIVSLISAVDLANETQRQFDAALARAELLKTISYRMVKDVLNRRPSVPLREALRDPALTNTLIDLGISKAVWEVAVLTPQNEILADSDPSVLGTISPNHPDFGPVVLRSGWLEKVRIVFREKGGYYQLQEMLVTPPADQPLVAVRVIINPAQIKEQVRPTIEKSAEIAISSIAGAVLITFLFSTIAFRPLGQLGQMLDLVAEGEFVPEKLPPGNPAARDEVSVIASKVSLLGERLRGAQSEVSDLRGNFERLLHDLEDAVFIFSRERRLVFASGSVEKFLGRSSADLGGLSVFDIFPPVTPLGLLIAQAAQTGRPMRNRRVPVPSAPDSSRVAVVLVSVDMLEGVPGSANPGAGMLVRLRDPEATRKLGRELQTADRMAAISRITGGVAHEVKNPLNAILLHVEVARAKLAKGDTGVEPQMEIISREILRLDRVVKTFLDFTRPVELNLTEVPLEQFVGELVDLARPQAEASHLRVEMHQDVGAIEVRIDRDLMKQALLNIVVNAIEAMPGGGELTFEAHALEDSAEIRISDTGAGIPPELREKIFRLYFTTKQAGSGIGLAMTYRIVQLHDGTIDFTSEPGKGTTFSVRLPTTV